MFEMRKGADYERIYEQGYAVCDTKHRAENDHRGDPSNDCSACCAVDRSKLLCRLRPYGRHEVSRRQTAFSGNRKSSGGRRYAELGITGLDRRTVAYHVHRRKCSVRSEERRVGKECRSRWTPDYSKK